MPRNKPKRKLLKGTPAAAQKMNRRRRRKSRVNLDAMIHQDILTGELLS
jgi:hypothetical protein